MLLFEEEVKHVWLKSNLRKRNLNLPSFLSNKAAQRSKVQARKLLNFCALFRMVTGIHASAHRQGDDIV